MKKISVIIPVYNTEKYLKKCLDSVINQTYKNIEIIIVNDGSPDNSDKIIQSFQNKYPDKIRAFNKINGGLSDARNYGIEKSTGEYIAFLDSDDYVEKNCYELLMNKACAQNFDIVVCDFNNVYKNKIIQGYSNINNDITEKEKIKTVYKNIYPSAWNKLYKKELFDKIKFKKGVWYEDVEFLYRLLPSVKSIGVVKLPLINYVHRDGAITKTFDERLYHYIDNWNGLLEYYKQNNLLEEYSKEFEYCYVRYLFATFIKQATHYKDFDEYKKAVDVAIKNVKTNFPNYKKNKLFYSSLKGIYLILFNKYIAISLYKKYSKSKKLMFISSTGGHFNEMAQLKPMLDKYEYYIVTEKTSDKMYLKNKYPKKVSYLIYGTKDNFWIYPFKLFYNTIKSLFIYLKVRPKVIITTGAHTAGPMCCIGKILGSKIIFIESMANITTKTITGRIIYKFADLFIVQWESMLELYPKATYGGWIF